jgi:4-hydroxybenzoyl-CoA thioesterase
MDVTRHSVRVEFGDCDPARIAYYPNFFLWFDRATHKLFESAGVPIKDLMSCGIGTPLVHAEASFVKPAGWGESLEVESRIERLGGRSLVIGHVILKTASGDVVARGTETRAFVRVEHGADTRITPMDVPPEVRQAFTPIASD